MLIPVMVHSETNAVTKHAKEICSFGKKALIVTGKRSSYQNGSIDDVCAALQGGKCDYIIFDDVEENPSVDTVMKATKAGQKEKVDFVIGIGGGSPLDAAKAVAFLLAQPTIHSRLLYTEGNHDHLPLILIPTTCGTGSEVTPVSVLTIPEKQTKKSISHKIFADLALIDGKYLRTASIAVLRNTALDALTHLIESYLNKKADDFSRMFVDSGLKLWRENKDCLENGELSDRQYQKLMNASAMAGMAIAQTSTTIPHGLSYSLTIKKHVPHGKAVGYFTAGYLAQAPDKERSYLLKSMGFHDTDSFERWYLRLYGKTEVSEKILDQAIEELWKNQPKVQSASFKIDKETLKQIAYYTANYKE